MTDILKDTPAYRWMTDDAREEGVEQGIELGRKAEREAYLEQLRQKVVALVTIHFPKLARFAKKQISDVEDTERLLDLIVDLRLASNTDDITKYLLALDEEEPITR